ncbi:MAG: DUF3179 domain-containing protein [Phycisphaerales bacterium]|nr:MAG: DUF3179 domain-containing protein [Phycisphaerales bacterium]
MNNKTIISALLAVLFAVLMLAESETAYPRRRAGTNRDSGFYGLRTNTSKRAIKLSELQSGGPGKDGIPAVDSPVFVEQEVAEKWLRPNEPVIAVVVKGQSRAYPLQILMWHEIVNDNIAGIPVAVTFCPLCYSANVFDRRIEAKTYSFGVSGLLRNSDMVMYDRQTESLWQQITGEAIVGDMLDSKLNRIPAQIISFRQFGSAYKNGLVLSRETGYRRAYGKNPYAGYDDIRKKPFMYRGRNDRRLRPMEKVVAVSLSGKDKAYPYSVTRRLGAINDEIAGMPLVVFHSDGAVSALDKARIASSRQAGSTGVFERKIDGRLLSFKYDDGVFYDEQTESAWDITGRAVKGLLAGKQLKRIIHGDYFAFAWLVFKPQTTIYRQI